jgi:hypothetical protein
MAFKADLQLIETIQVSITDRELTVTDDRARS